MYKKGCRPGKMNMIEGSISRNYCPKDNGTLRRVYYCVTPGVTARGQSISISRQKHQSASASISINQQKYQSDKTSRHQDIKTKKKSSPSTLRRNARRKEAFLQRKQNPAPVECNRMEKTHSNVIYVEMPSSLTTA